MKSVTAAQERLDMRSGCHAAKILPVGVRGTKNVWCLSSLILSSLNSILHVHTLVKKKKEYEILGIRRFDTIDREGEARSSSRILTTKNVLRCLES